MQYNECVYFINFYPKAKNYKTKKPPVIITLKMNIILDGELYTKPLFINVIIFQITNPNLWTNEIYDLQL